MTGVIDRLLDAEPVHRIRRVQLLVVLAFYVYGYLSPDPVGRETLGLGDTVLHSIGSGILLVSAWVATRERLRMWITATLAGLFSFGLEFAQSFAPLRHFDWADLAMNGLGVGVAALTLAALHRVGWISRL